MSIVPAPRLPEDPLDPFLRGGRHRAEHRVPVCRIDRQERPNIVDQLAERGGR
jgi:hypothetical protein